MTAPPVGVSVCLPDGERAGGEGKKAFKNNHKIII
jgi:hypothetical protein